MTADTSSCGSARAPISASQRLAAGTAAVRDRGRAIAARGVDLLRWRVLMPLRYPKRTVPVGEFSVRVHRTGEWIARQLITTGGYEQHEIAEMCALVRPGDTVLDVGANIGLHTLHLSRAVGPTGTVHAFEPDPANFALLTDNVARNGCTNVVAHPYGLGPEAAQHRLYACKGNKGFQSLAKVEWSTSEVVVEIKRAADVLDGVDAALMKVDVEGAEAFVLRGFATWPPVVVFEFVPAQLRAMDEDPIAFLQGFLDRGYTLTPIGGAEAPVEVDDAASFAALADGTGDDYNLVARVPSAA